MGVRRSVGCLIVAALLAAPGAAAQEPGPGPGPAPAESGGFWSSVGHAVGGAVVGGWMGWVGAQVSVGDWAKNTNHDLMDQRVSWVAGGMAVGLLVSQLVGETSPPVRPELRPARDGRNVLTRAALEEAGVETVHDLLSRERPHWLSPRGTNSWAESTRGRVDEQGGVVIPGEVQVWVYLDASRLGGVETLKEISPRDLERIEYIEPARAALLYGAGHVHGVIQLRTRTDDG